MSEDQNKYFKKANTKKKIRKLTREEKLATALKRNIKLRKENKKN